MCHKDSSNLSSRGAQAGHGEVIRECCVLSWKVRSECEVLPFVKLRPAPVDLLLIRTKQRCRILNLQHSCSEISVVYGEKERS